MTTSRVWPSPLTFRTEVEFTCPFCSKRANAGEATTVRGNEPAVTHELPQCPEFQRMDALEYMQAVNTKLREMKS